MNEWGRWTGGNMFREPANEGLHLRNIIGLSAEVAFNPPFDLASHETLRVTKFSKPGRLPINSVDLDQGIYDHRRYVVAEILSWGYILRERGIDDDAFASFHNVERDTQDSQVVAEGVGHGRQGKNGMYLAQKARLAFHIVGFSRHWSKRPATQHTLPVSNLQQVGQMRSPPLKFPHLVPTFP